MTAPTATRREDVLSFIREYTSEHQVPPVLREISVAVGLSPTSLDAARRHVLYHLEQGHLHPVGKGVHVRYAPVVSHG